MQSMLQIKEDDIPKKLLDEIHEKRSRRTVEKYKTEWVANIKANVPRIKNQVSDLWMDVSRDEIVSVAAGPSLSADLEDLKRKAKGREVVCADAAFRYCVENEVYPDFVVCTDASEKIMQMIEGLKDKHTNLVANVIMNPRVIEAWGGGIYWFVMANDIIDEDAGRAMQDVHGLESRVGSKIAPGGNVSSIMLGFCLSVRNASKVLLYGHDFCWKDDFYCGGAMKDLAAERIKVETDAGTAFDTVNKKGESVKTNLSLKQFALWHEDATKYMRGRIENRTSSTMLRI